MFKDKSIFIGKFGKVKVIYMNIIYIYYSKIYYRFLKFNCKSKVKGVVRGGRI